jgi:urease accessory protein
MHLEIPTPCADASLPSWLPWLLQVSDSQFPSGAYAHSMGLEELTQSGFVKNADEVDRFIHQQILPSLCAFELPFLARVHRAAAADDLEQVRRYDEELEAWKLAAEMRQASRQIGSRRLALLRKLRPSPLLEQYAERESPCHHLVVCALELREAPAVVALGAFALQTLSGYASAAMKLVRMGQERSQTIIRGAMAKLTPRLDTLVSEEPEHLGWFNPLLEIASMRHAVARERLFIS